MKEKYNNIQKSLCWKICCIFFLLIFLFGPLKKVVSAENTNGGIDRIEERLSVLEAQKDFFLHILNLQLVIFSVVVAAIIGLSWLYHYKVSKSEIRKEVAEAKEKMKVEFGEIFKEQSSALTIKIEAVSNQQKRTVKSLRGRIYRTLGSFWDSQKSYSVAFIWWIRAAYNFASVGEESLARIALGSAKESVEKVKYGYQLDYKDIGEFQNLLSEIDSQLYKIEKEMLDEAFKQTLSRKPTTP